MKKKLDSALKGSIGERSVGVIVERELGFIYRDTASQNDVGYDGEIEIRDIDTKEVLGLIVKVQSKALSDLEAEDQNGFNYRCTQSDYDYWMNSNVPDILVISRPNTEEFYWSPIKKYFEIYPEQKESRIIKFNKKDSSLSEKSRKEIADLAAPKDKGLYLAPLPMQETIYTNLLQIKRFPGKIYVAHTEKSYEEITGILHNNSYFPFQWILKNKTIISFDNLNDPAWMQIIGREEVEALDSSEWLNSSDPSKHNEILELLYRNFQDLCKLKNIRYLRSENYYYFMLTPGAAEREEKYKSRKANTSRKVVTPVYSKDDLTKVQYFRHFAFSVFFVRYDDKYYMDITPTYHMTRDGSTPDKFQSKKISGLKRLQKNESVLGEVICIARILSQPLEQQIDSDKYIEFDELLTLEITGGIDDKQWLSTDKESEFIESDDQEEELNDEN